ncbi:MAG: radical SAM protein [Bacteroidales bacterium]
MQPIDQYQKELADGNRREYGLYYDQLRKLSYYRAAEADDERSRLLQSIDGKAGSAFNGTKPFAHHISPGCRLCGEGQWSCLFVNNRCNCNCFYCPTPQIDTGIPETQGLNFSDPRNYVDYIRKFGFKGVSLSGGEPLLTFDTTLDFLRTVKHEFGTKIYLWLYTNGTLLTEEKAELLAAAGLDELRFDLSATAYSTRFLKHALGKIPSVTVEIPAIPEEIEQMKQMAVELDQLGVNFLNLHQMRLTPYNLKNLLHRNYTFLHGPRMTVLESELAALEMIRFTFEQGLHIGVNYCSFHYKNHFQKAGFRHKLAPFIAGAFEEITENGYIRKFYQNISTQAYHALNDDQKSGQYCTEEQRLYLTKDQVVASKLPEFPVHLEYFSTSIHKTPVENGTKILLNNSLPVFIGRKPAGQKITVLPQELVNLQKIMAGEISEEETESREFLDILQKEIPAKGFGTYY